MPPKLIDSAGATSSTDIEQLSASASRLAWSGIEVLTDILSDGHDLRSALSAALTFALDFLGRKNGALIILSSEEREPELLVAQNIPDSWKAWLDSADSPLRNVIRRLLESGETAADPDLGLAAAVPLVARTHRLGVLLVEGRACSAAERAQLESLARVVGRALRSSHAYQSWREADRELAALHMIATILTSNLELDEIQKAMVDGIRQILHCKIGCLALLDEQGSLVVKKVLGDGPEWMYRVTQKVAEGLVQDCLRELRPIRVNDLSERPELIAAMEAEMGVAPRSILCVPMLAGNLPFGVLQMINKCDDGFSDYDQELLGLLGTSMADAIYNKRLIQQLKVVNADLESNRWELLNSRNTLRALFDSIPSSMYIVDRKYNLKAVNRSRARRARSRPNVLVGRRCYEALFHRDDPCIGCRIAESLFQAVSTTRHWRQWEDESDPQEWEISTYPIHDESGQAHQAIVLEQDVTERRRLEANLAQSEKLAAVGQLAAGVAHEINNPLTAVIANAQILQRSLPPGSDAAESVELILLAGSRAAQVVRNLLDFARKEQYKLERTDINDTIRKALGLLQHEFLSRAVKLQFDPGEDLPPLLASADHLQGVWLNLMMNAMDSFDGQPGEIHLSTHRHGGEVQVIVADTGKGIPADHLSRIFEPFFTTKAPGRGTGLGLSVCHRIVKQHGGHIVVDSQAGQGTKFTVSLPIS
jgi:two-component system, NtrC family, sensor kinase